MKKNQESLSVRQAGRIKNHKKESPENLESMKFFEKRLMDFFRKAGREHLPWRKKKVTAYEVWVSEIMLQQTQVSRVIGYYTRFLKRFPDVGSLARADWETFLPYYQGLGYYARGRNMLTAARIIVERYHGIFPRDKKLLQTLPGVGPYTAAAILSFAYGDNHLAWDTNLKRLIGRFFFGGKHLIDDEALWENTFQSPKKVLNAALMDFGSAVCVARPKCGICPLQTRCVYYREEGVKELRIPVRPVGGKKKESRMKSKKEKSIDWREAQAYIFLHENHKIYYSSNTKKFQPFILPSGYNTRTGIKKYFQEKYVLLLSVRPPHRKMLVQGEPVLLINAQILSGKPTFATFFKTERKRYTESIR